MSALPAPHTGSYEDDHGALAGIRTGDPDALAWIVGRHQLGLRSWCYQHFPAVAEDVVQEALARLWANPPERWSTGGARAWLKAVARNAAVDGIRREVSASAAAQRSAAADTLESPELSVMSALQAEAILGSIRPEDADLLRAHYIDDASMQELARREGISYESMKTRLSRTRQRAMMAARRMGYGVLAPWHRWRAEEHANTVGATAGAAVIAAVAALVVIVPSLDGAAGPKSLGEPVSQIEQTGAPPPAPPAPSEPTTAAPEPTTGSGGGEPGPAAAPEPEPTRRPGDIDGPTIDAGVAVIEIFNAPEMPADQRVNLGSGALILDSNDLPPLEPLLDVPCMLGLPDALVECTSPNGMRVPPE